VERDTWKVPLLVATGPTLLIEMAYFAARQEPALTVAFQRWLAQTLVWLLLGSVIAGPVVAARIGLRGRRESGPRGCAVAGGLVLNVALVLGGLFVVWSCC
jgi:hypothetical protein